jgi:predicted transcriptional regulator
MFGHNEEKMEKKLKKIKAVDVMSKFAITARNTDTIESLAHLMMRFKISGVPVVSNNEEIVGILTAKDLFSLMKAITSDIDNGLELLKYQDLKVDTIMTKDVITITEETTLYEIIKIMCNKNIHTLPVMGVENKEIAGVIGRRDILNAFYVSHKRKSK